MRVTFHPLDADDVLALRLQPSQLVEAGINASQVTEASAIDLVNGGAAWAAYAGGRVLCCAGIRELFAGRQGVAWAMLAADIGVAAHLTITRFARARIAESPLVRIECLIADDPRAASWARLVGMPREATLRCWGAASETIHVHARIREPR